MRRSTLKLGGVWLAAVGCVAPSAVPSQTIPPPAPARVDFRELARACIFAHATGEDGQPVDGWKDVSCPQPGAGMTTTDQDQGLAAVYAAAAHGVLTNQQQFAAMKVPPLPTQPIGTYRATLFYFPSKQMFLEKKAADASGRIAFYESKQVLEPELYATLREQYLIWSENNIETYCKALPSNPDEEARERDKGPCAMTMIVIKVNRDQRAEAAQQRERLQAQLADEEAERRLEQQIVDLENRRRQAAALGALADGLGRMGQSMRAQPVAPLAPLAPLRPLSPRPAPRPPSYGNSTFMTPPAIAPIVPPGRPSQSGCSSDFQCSPGQKCVKPNYSVTGTCMREANQYGTPTYTPPRVDSVMPKLPKPSDCKLITDCPPGFRCDVRTGACVRP